jgi:hypothetical protein
VGDKFSVEIDSPHENFEFMCFGWHWTLHQIMHPQGIWVHTLGIHYESQVLDEILSKEGLLYLHLQLMLAYQFNHFSHMLQMVFPRVIEDKNTIQINNNKLT